MALELDLGMGSCREQGWTEPAENSLGTSQTEDKEAEVKEAHQMEGQAQGKEASIEESKSRGLGGGSSGEWETCSVRL